MKMKFEFSHLTHVYNNSVTVRPSRNTAVTPFSQDEITMEGGKLPGP
jgi:hypothetical protein